MLDDNLYLKIVSISILPLEAYKYNFGSNKLSDFCAFHQIDFGDAKALYNCENYGAPFYTKTVRTEN